MVDRADLEIDGLDGTKAALDVAQHLVAADGIGGAQLLLWKIGANDVDAVERRLGCGVLGHDVEGETVILDVEREVLRDLVLVDDLADEAALDGIYVIRT